MARILIYNPPAPGHVFPPIATALVLRDRGHEVIVRTEAESVATVERLGFAAAPIDPRIEAVPLLDWKARSSISALKMAFETFDERARYEVPDLQGAIEAERPDLICVDLISLGASATAEASGLPWAHFLPSPHPRPARGVPSFGPGFRPSDGVLARLRDSSLTTLAELGLRGWLRRQNARRASLGLPPFESAFRDPSVAAPLLVQFSAEPFEYPREWPPNVRLVGPALWEAPAPEPDWLAAEERPIVLATASTTYQNDAELIEATLAALADTPYAVVATTAAHDPAEFDVPANAVVERYLPHGPLLRRATVAISHGGMGSTQKALAAGVPVCVVPFMRDQFEVGRRVEHCGAGTFLSARRLRPDRLRAAVVEAVACRAGAERVRDAFARGGGAEAAASALEGLLKVPA